MRSVLEISLALSRAIFFALCLSIALYAMAKPDRPQEKKPSKQVPIPRIAGESRWGIIAQDGRAITIDGHDHWYVLTGEIRADGKLFVVWIRRSDGRAGPGLYDIGADGSISGRWGWGDVAEQDDNGNWRGLNMFDTLR